MYVLIYAKLVFSENSWVRKRESLGVVEVKEYAVRFLEQATSVQVHNSFAGADYQTVKAKANDFLRETDQLAT